MPSVFDMLEEEWVRLAGVPPGELAGICAAVGCTTLGELSTWVRSAPPSEADRVLVPLAARAVAGSALAARVLLQLLLRGTCRLARSWWVLGDAEERAAAAVAAVYGRIRRYPVERRPGRVAANILLDARQDLCRAARRASRHASRVSELDLDAVPALAGEDDPHPAEELAEVLEEAVALRRIRAEDAELIAATRIGGRRLADVAAERGAKVRTLQWRRQVAEAALINAGAVA